VSRELARIQRTDFIAYYRRLGRDAVHEATRRWIAWLGASGFVGLLTLVLLLIVGDGLTSALWGLIAFVAAWLLFVLWFLVTLPPRIEREMQNKEENLRVLSQRRNVANELRNHMIQCRMTAQEARAAEIGANGQGGTIAYPQVETYHQQALRAAHHAEERLVWLSQQSGHSSYESSVIEILGAVSTKKCARADEAIAQLEALADVIERQLSSPVYW
jgi:hypothetical protein